ncbi:MAG: hypothetical protein AAGM46_26060, partial [Cyanobacteria bacterium J06582_2]
MECQSCFLPKSRKCFENNSNVCIACSNKKKKNPSRSEFAIDRNVVNIHFNPTLENKFDLNVFFKNIKQDLFETTLLHSQRLKGIKWRAVLFVTLKKNNKFLEEVYHHAMFHSHQTITLNSFDLKQNIDRSILSLSNKFEDYTSSGSGWVLSCIDNLVLQIVDYSPLPGSLYTELPEEIKAKKAVLNIKNNDNKCFIYSILAHLHPAEINRNRVNNYIPFVNTLNLNDISFPITIQQIPIFERNNNIKINILEYEHNKFSPYYISDSNSENIVNLLIYNSHYSLITNLSRLLAHLNNRQNAKHFCFYCFKAFIKPHTLQKHISSCKLTYSQKVKLPGKNTKDEFLSFDKFPNQLKVPFVIYCDLESITSKISNCSPNPELSSTTKYERHECCSYGYKVVCVNPTFSKPLKIVRSKNPIQLMIRDLLNERDYINEILENHIAPMRLSFEEELEFNHSNICHICENPLGADRVRNHCHLTGNFLGAAHSNCNLQFKYSKKNGGYLIPVIFHNLSGYDSHLILSNIGQLDSKLKLNCIPHTNEKYLSFSLMNLRFIDSFQFLSSSLESLGKNLSQNDNSKFIETKKYFGEDFHQLLGKGSYPYEYMDSFDKFEIPQLPPKDQFNSKLNNQSITDEKYQQCVHLWEKFNMRNMGDFHDLYLRQDILLLTDVFENFRNLSCEYYKLDPCHYFSAPGLFWDSMLKKTKVKLQLFTDEEQLSFIEGSIRGGISTITTRHATANNVYLDDYCNTQPSSYILPLDANNLYGHSMSQPLPTSQFSFLTTQEIRDFDILSADIKGETGYILEVDLDYPQHLHDKHNHLPLAPEHLTVNAEMLSEYSTNTANHLGFKPIFTKKLIPNLRNKQNYIVHFANLKMYIEQGMILKKIHRIMKFRQSAWMEPYIQFNTRQRQLAKNDFEKSFFKLANNAVFGRTMMNVRKHKSVQLVNSVEQLRKLTSRRNYHSFTIFNPNLIAVNLVKTEVEIKQPIYVGFTVLELSKKLMYEFHYNHIVNKYGEQARLLFTDTDSLVY